CFVPGQARSRPSAGSGSRERKKRRRWTSSHTKESTGTIPMGSVSKGPAPLRLASALRPSGYSVLTGAVYRLSCLSQLQASRVYPISSRKEEVRQRSSQPCSDNLDPGPPCALSEARGINYQGAPNHSGPNRKGKKSPCAVQPGQEAPCHLMPPFEFSPGPSRQCRSSAANIDLALAYLMGGDIPHEGWWPSPRRCALQAGPRPKHPDRQPPREIPHQQMSKW